MPGSPLAILSHDGVVLLHLPGAATVLLSASGARSAADLLIRAARDAEADRSGSVGVLTVRQADVVRTRGPARAKPVGLPNARCA